MVEEEILPSLRRYGCYPPPQDQLVTQAEKFTDLQITTWEMLGHLVEKGKKMSLDIAEAKNVAQRADGKADEALQKTETLEVELEQTRHTVHHLTGGDFFRTVRLRMSEHDIRYDQETAKAIGAACYSLARNRGIEAPPKIQEGTYLVNQWPIDLLDEVIEDMGLLRQR